MSQVNDVVEQVRMAFGRLNQREQVMVVGGGVGAILLIFIILTLVGNSAIAKAEHRVRVKTEQLQEVLQFRDQYRLRKAENERRLKDLGRAGVRLVSLVEDVARQSGVEIGQLRPAEGEPNEEGIIESRVELSARELSIDRLQDFLQRIESSKGVVIVRRLQLDKPYRKETINVELEIMTFKTKS